MFLYGHNKSKLFFSRSVFERKKISFWILSVRWVAYMFHTGSKIGASVYFCARIIYKRERVPTVASDIQKPKAAISLFFDFQVTVAKIRF